MTPVTGVPMSFTYLRYHITFATKSRRPFITRDVEPVVYEALRDACRNQDGKLFEVSGIEDHVHLLSQVPQSVSIEKFVKETKRQSTLQIKEECEHLPDFKWQAKFGALTVSSWDMGKLYRYIRNQEEHHRTGQTWEGFEEVA